MDWPGLISRADGKWWTAYKYLAGYMLGCREQYSFSSKKPSLMLDRLFNLLVHRVNCRTSTSKTTRILRICLVSSRGWCLSCTLRLWAHGLIVFWFTSPFGEHGVPMTGILSGSPTQMVAPLFDRLGCCKGVPAHDALPPVSRSRLSRLSQCFPFLPGLVFLLHFVLGTPLSNHLCSDGRWT